MTIPQDIAAQIDAAFDFRGHITLTLNDGKTVEGFLFNRELTPMKGEAYVEILKKDSDERVRYAATQVKSVTLSGKDFAVPFVAPKKD
jgi:hypothetical protein